MRSVYFCLSLICASSTQDDAAFQTPNQPTNAALPVHADNFDDGWIQHLNHVFVTPEKPVRPILTTPPVAARPSSAPGRPTKKPRA